jgi:AbrB family looped-hinge helix DNA binding protein
MEWVRVGRDFQITLPKSVRQYLHLNEGDLLAVKVRDDELVLRPQAAVDRDQAWYWSPEWQAAEREADSDTRAGRYDDFESMDDMIADLQQQAEDRKEP